MRPAPPAYGFLQLAKLLLGTVGSDWASRVFYTDDGSTATEVALKMAFRKFAVDSAAGGADEHAQSSSNSDNDSDSPAQPAGSWARQVEAHRLQYQHRNPQEVEQYHVLGLLGAYHGDTLGSMDAGPPSAFGSPLQTPWYQHRGLFLDAPTVALQCGAARLTLPPALGDAAAALGDAAELGSTLADAFSRERDGSPLEAAYREYIAARLRLHREALPGVRVAACMLEPVLQGAGGMRLVDPLFQRALVRACRQARKECCQPGCGWASALSRGGSRTEHSCWHAKDAPSGHHRLPRGR
jgi:dethiobiotin synthetase/adenosylmethionine--8-amino-7-oxononanoate aminotransferase